MKSVEKRGGLDKFLLKAGNDDLSDRVLKLKRIQNRQEASLPDEIINYLVPRCCGIAAEYLDAFQVAELLSAEDEPPEDFQFGESILLPAKIFAAARKKYDEFVSGVPAPLQPALEYEGRDWFERFVSEMPEKKKKPAKRKKA